MKTARLTVPLAAALLAGCGGGLYLELGPDDDPPSVALVAGGNVGSAAPGSSVLLHADASDDDYVLEVVFYRLEPGGGATRLCIDTAASYDCGGPIPANAPVGSSVRFFARAWDSAGQARDSDVLSIAVV